MACEVGYANDKPLAVVGAANDSTAIKPFKIVELNIIFLLSALSVIVMATVMFKDSLQTAIISIYYASKFSLHQIFL